MNRKIVSYLWLCALIVAAGCKIDSQPNDKNGVAAGNGHHMPGIDCPLRNGDGPGPTTSVC